MGFRQTQFGLVQFVGGMSFLKIFPGSRGQAAGRRGCVGVFPGSRGQAAGRRGCVGVFPGSLQEPSSRGLTAGSRVASRALSNALYWLILLLSTPSHAQTAEGQYAMVSSSQHLATKVGVEILKRGGNAVDAAVAMGYALSVVHPCCGNLGGGGFMMLHLVRPEGKSRNIFINFREKAPTKIKGEMFFDKQGKQRLDLLKQGEVTADSMKTAYLKVGVPGTVMGLNRALREYGTMPLKQVMQPAIELAKKGYVLDRQDADFLAGNLNSMEKQPYLHQIFIKPNNRPYGVGDRLVQADLAKTLEKIAAQGDKGFYEGEIAKSIVKAAQSYGGVLTLKDFADYTVTELEPLYCDYHGYHFVLPPPPSSGGVALCEIFNILSGYELEHGLKHTPYYRHPETIHYMIEAMRYTFADRNEKLGDPDFVDNPVQQLTSKAHAEKIRAKILPTKAGDSRHMGVYREAASREGHSTTHYSVVDREGNAASVTVTLNSFFGSRVMPVHTGVFLNNQLDDFALSEGAANKFGLIQGGANLIAPGKRPLSSMSPLLIFDHQNRLVAVMGTPGGPTIITQLATAIHDFIDGELPFDEAVNAPRYHMQWLPDVVFMEEDAFPKHTLSALRRMGYRFRLGSPYGAPRWGAVAAISRDVISGRLLGVIDVRRPGGLALGY